MEQAHEQDLECLKLLRYMDDDFMTACPVDNHAGVPAMYEIMEDMRNEAAKEAGRSGTGYCRINSAKIDYGWGNAV